MTHAESITRIEIDQLWSGRHSVAWTLDRHVNVLSGVNGVGKSTILNKLIRSIGPKGELGASHGGVTILTDPPGATHLRYDVIRSFDRPLVSSNLTARIDLSIVTELDLQMYNLQRRYLDYQVNIGNRIIAALQSGEADAALKAQQISNAKARFQDIVDDLFRDTGKRIVRTENEIRFSQIGEVLSPFQLSSGEKQMLAILLTVLTEDGEPTVLFMDEPEVSLHVDWQQRLIDLILELNPNVQIILTTHSPAVIMNGWMDHVTEVSDILVDEQHNQPSE